MFGLYNQLNEDINHFGHFTVQFQIDELNNLIEMVSVNHENILKQLKNNDNVQEFMEIVIDTLNQENEVKDYLNYQFKSQLKCIIQQNNSQKISFLDSELTNGSFNFKKLFSICLNASYQSKIIEHVQSYITKQYEKSIFKWQKVKHFKYNMHKCNSYMATVNNSQKTFQSKYRSKNTHHNKILHSNIINDKQYIDELLRNYNQQQQYQNFELSNFIPDAYTFNFKSRKYNKIEQQFMNLDVNTNTDSWIYKPVLELQGRGIQIFKDLKTAQDYCRAQKQKSTYKYERVLIQKYVKDIVTWDDKKFDLRCYLFIAGIQQGKQQAYYHPGYFRITKVDYQKNQDSSQINYDDLSQHLTNQNYQKYINVNEQDMYQGLTKTWEDLEDYLLNNIKLSQKRIDLIQIQIKQIITFLSQAYFQRLKEKNYEDFMTEIYGIDIMFDSNWTPIFIEANEGPTQNDKNEILKQQISPLVESMNEIIYESVENFQMQQKNNITDKPYFDSKQKVKSLELLVDNYKDYDYLNDEKVNEFFKDNLLTIKDDL